jgi:hypothetical protein
MNTSWWIDPAVQRDYDAFRELMLSELPRMRTEKGAVLVDALANQAFREFAWQKQGGRFAGVTSSRMG